MFFMFIFVGLGNPGIEYEDTRHNVGRIMLTAIARNFHAEEFVRDKKLNALTTVAEVAGEKVKLIMPETFMNKSGSSIAPLILTAGKANLKKAEQLVVIYDDLDLPFGTVKMSFNRSSGGHRGVESIIKSIKTEAFVRIRIGISPTTPSGKMKKPLGDKVVGDFILGKFKPAELDALKKLSKKVIQAVETFTSEGSSSKALAVSRQKAMGEINSN
jgi:PTH1 family peptidyl-tRNA hydrolase